MVYAYLPERTVPSVRPSVPVVVVVARWPAAGGGLVVAWWPVRDVRRWWRRRVHATHPLAGVVARLGGWGGGATAANGPQPAGWGRVMAVGPALVAWYGPLGRWLAARNPLGRSAGFFDANGQRIIEQLPDCPIARIR